MACVRNAGIWKAVQGGRQICGQPGLRDLVSKTVLQRIHIWFPAPAVGSSLPGKTSSTGSDLLTSACICIYVAHTEKTSRYTHIHVKYFIQIKKKMFSSERSSRAGKTDRHEMTGEGAR